MNSINDNDFDMIKDDTTIDLTIDEDIMVEQQEEREEEGFNNSSNNLKFYPYSNNKLTRSVGTLNLSLSNTNLPQKNNLNLIKEDHKDTVDAYINRWSPFNDNEPTTPTLKRSASKSGLSPFIKNSEVLRKWRYNKSSSSSLRYDCNDNDDKINKNNKYGPNTTKHPTQFEDKENVEPRRSDSTQQNEDSFTVAKPNMSAFSPNGLKSKVSQLSNFNPKKLNIPNTPVKKHPLRGNARLMNISSSNYSPTFGEESIISPNHNLSSFTAESIMFPNSPSLKTPKDNLPNLKLSPLSGGQNSAQSNRFFSPEYNLNKYKKIKKSRDSIVLKNMELSNSLQQFTDDLYGTDDNINNIAESNSSDSRPNTAESELTFFTKFPPPIKITQADSASSKSDDDDNITTPTRMKKSIAGASDKTNFQKHSLLETPFKAQPRHISRKAMKVEESNPDAHLFEQFSNVQVIGQGQFSVVYRATFPETKKKYAIKSLKADKHNPRSRILQEIKILAEIRDSALDHEGKEYVINFISSWKHMDSFYVMTDFYENGNLDRFLSERIISKKKKLEDWRVWKIIVELSLALRFIHNSCHVVHLDLKPANVLITFEGNLKLGDFGMATHLPLEDGSFENEGDREYIAPEIISDCIYDYRADIFSLGLMIVEIAANIVLPDNGNAWHKLRSGDLSDAGRLSSTEIHSESLFSTNTKVERNLTEITDLEIFENDNDSESPIKNRSNISLRTQIPPWVPRFLIDGESLERIVKWMIDPNYRNRPTADNILKTEECQYVEITRRAGAIIQEDDFGPKPNFFE